MNLHQVKLFGTVGINIEVKLLNPEVIGSHITTIVAKQPPRQDFDFLSKLYKDRYEDSSGDNLFADIEIPYNDKGNCTTFIEKRFIVKRMMLLETLFCPSL